jgi:hypothetical protein
MIGQKKAPDNQGRTLTTRRAAKKPNNTKKQKKLLGGAGWGARNTDPTSTIEVAKPTAAEQATVNRYRYPGKIATIALGQ